ncbi:M23 family metallopeptidase [Exilibacterium tricleocarpae]|uniref:M23 family metallopeptidase n=1 Tax=Exilibacterium tricleocarpae TaxID=2591008 RepID=A0A545TLD7_9GAMM|nr:M23 family metallopeptidase [Exilibacterium tricleocarpae]TQV78035.1 M23 family metallopeptidase [Exilibacterium tricleocarpae]
MNHRSIRFIFTSLSFTVMAGCSPLLSKSTTESVEKKAADEIKINNSAGRDDIKGKNSSVVKTFDSEGQVQEKSLKEEEKNKEQEYIVKKGDTLSAIARRFYITPAQLQSRNKITDPNKLPIGIRLIVPGSKASRTTTSANSKGTKRKAEKSDQTVYVVKRGDTLSGIARRFSVTILQLQYRDKISNPHSLSVATSLVIPDKDLSVPASFLARSGGFIWPVKHLKITSDYGARSGQHQGIDFSAPRGTHILAAADGIVHFVGRQRGYGNVVILKHDGKVKTLYAHNDHNLVIRGQRVKQREVIAYVGRTGNATGYHVHFEYLKGGRKLNPRHYILVNQPPNAVAVN